MEEVAVTENASTQQPWETPRSARNPEPFVAASPRRSVASVLHVRVMAGTGGGPEKTILRSPRYGDADRYQLAAAYIHPTGDFGIESVRLQAEQLDCPLHTVAESGPCDPRTVWGLYQLCRRLNVSIWHGHDYKSNLIGLLLRRFRPMKLVNTVHLWTEETRRLMLYRKVDEWCLPRYDHTIAVSEPLADRCREIGVDDRALTYVPNAIEPDVFRPMQTCNETRRELGLPVDATIIGVVGRLSVQKGLDRFLPVVAKLTERVPNLQLLLVGDGPQREPLTRLVEQLELGDVVRFVGWQRDARPWYEAMDLMVLPSIREGLPNAVLEAMAMGTATATTDVGGVRDLVDSGRCGLLLDENRDAWVEPLAELLHDESRRRRMASAARRRIEQRFAFAHRMQRITRIYDALLGIEAARAAA